MKTKYTHPFCRVHQLAISKLIAATIASTTDDEDEDTSVEVVVNPTGGQTVSLTDRDNIW